MKKNMQKPPRAAKAKILKLAPPSNNCGGRRGGCFITLMPYFRKAA